MIGKIKKYCTYLLLSILFTLLGSVVTNASEFYVTPVLPENQKEGVIDYFYLDVLPNQEQTFFFEVTNKEDTDLKMLFTIGNAYTTMYGSIDYGDVQDTSLKYPLMDIASVDKQVVVPPKTTAKIPVNIKVPKEEFNGIILGGIEILEDPNIELAEGEMGAVNRIRNIIPIRLRENNEKIDPEIHLLEVKADSIEDKNAIALTIQNDQPVIIDRFYVDAEITKKGSKEVLYKQKRKDMQMAPNSSFDYPVFLGTKPFKAGTYVAYVTASAQGGYEWDLEKEFTITQEQADQFNRLSSLELEDDQSPILLYVGIAIGVIIIILVVVYLMKQRNKKQQSVSKKSRPKKKRK